MTQFYIECLASGFAGQAISILLILNSLNRKARISNLQFSAKQYFKDDLYLLIANVLTILTAMLLIRFALNYKPTWENYIVAAFFLIGYIGSDIPSRLASVANKRLNAAIDHKTTEADKVNNTLDAPTPTSLPRDKTK